MIKKFLTALLIPVAALFLLSTADARILGTNPFEGPYLSITVPGDANGHAGFEPTQAAPKCETVGNSQEEFLQVAKDHDITGAVLVTDPVKIAKIIKDIEALYGPKPADVNVTAIGVLPRAADGSYTIFVYSDGCYLVSAPVYLTDLTVLD